VKEKLQPHLPQGVTLLEVEEVGLHTRSIQSQLRWADYEVELPTDGTSTASLQESIDRLLAAQTWPAEYRRETKVRRYDLRPLVLDIRIETMREDCVLLSMSLRAEQERTARADQVVRALDLPEPRRIHRKALHLRRPPAAVLAFRRGDGQ
jgi:radical SAM-linked protein